MPIATFRQRIAQLTQALPSHPMGLALGGAVFNTLWFHGTLWNYLSQHLDFSDLNGWLTAIAVALLPTTMSVVFFTTAALWSNRLLKVCLVLVFLGNALAHYFMHQYQVLLDRTMMGNVWQTHWGEASALWHPMMLASLLFWGVLPAALVWVWPLRRLSWRQRLAFWIVSPLSALGLIYALSFTWLWIDQHAGQIGSQFLPWSYVINSARHLDGQRQQQQTYPPLPDAEAMPLGPKRRVVVLVIGESARADRQGLLAEGRDTHASTRGLGVVWLSGAEACATYTVAALNCILSHRGDAAPDRTDMGEPLPNYLLRQGVDVVWRTANSGHPNVKARRFETQSDMQAQCPQGRCEHEHWDEGLLHGLKGLIEQSTQPRLLVVLHLRGSHGPDYHRKYPPEFERFKPTCTTVVLKNCDAQSLLNAYDNSIAYTDHVLAQLTQVLRGVDAASSWLYVADHGESLGEGGLYLHGVPKSVAPPEQYKIPLSLWLSEAFRQEVSPDLARLASRSGVGQGHVFHTVMGMLALQGGVYRPEFDLLKGKP